MKSYPMGTILDSKAEPVLRSTTLGQMKSSFWLGGSGRLRVADVEARPYSYHLWTYACARVIATNIASLHHTMVDKLDETKTIEEHPLLTLLEQPHATLTEDEFFSLVVLLLLVGGGDGQCFLVPWNTKTDEHVDLQVPIVNYDGLELFPLSGQFFEPIREKTNSGLERVSGWNFGLPGQANTKKIPFKNNEIIRIRCMNPYDMLRGNSPMMALTSALSQDLNADIYNNKIFENDARVAGLLSTEEPLTEQQCDEYLRIWQKNYGGPGNTNRMAVLGGGLKYQQFGLNHSEMQYTEQKEWNKSGFLAAFGLNKIAIGDYEKINFATIREGRKLLWYDTYIPMDKLILGAVNAQFVRYQDQGRLRLTSKYNEIPSLREDYDRRAKTVGILVNSGYPPALASRVSGINLSPDDLKQWPHLSEAPPKYLTASNRTDSDASGDDGTGANNAATRNSEMKIETREERLLVVNDYIARVLDPAEKSFGIDLKRYFFSQRNGILDKIDLLFKSHKAIETKAPEIDPAAFIPDEAAELDKFMLIYRKGAKKQLELETAKLEDELDGLISWNVTEETITVYTSARKEFLRQINSKTFDKVGDVIGSVVEEGISEGWTVDELAKNIKTSVQNVYRVRTGEELLPHGKYDLGGLSSSKTIARTEMGIIAGEARYDAFKAEGIEKWEWLTAGDEMVRADHQLVDGTIVNVGEVFPYVGLTHPKESGGALDQIINCRCVAVAA